MRRIVVLALALLPGACGGGTSASAPNAHVFCEGQESIVCDKTFACVPAAERTDAFFAVFGHSVAECKSTIAADCATSATDCPNYVQSEGEACLAGINALRCDLDPVYPASCVAACGAGGGTGGGGGTTPSAQNAQVFCESSESIICDKFFMCVPVADRDQAFFDLFGHSVSECKGMIAADCATTATDCPTYVKTEGEACLAGLNALSCDVDPVFPTSCSTACP